MTCAIHSLKIVNNVSDAILPTKFLRSPQLLLPRVRLTLHRALPLGPADLQSDPHQQALNGDRLHDENIA